jgi:radical SAM protein with 4Fe4S-binding SPASM domain
MSIGPSILAPMAVSPQPETIDLEPVHNCNLRCPSCHVPQEDLTGEELPLESIAAIGERPDIPCKLGTTHEPTTHSQFGAMINILTELGLRIGLTTNGTLLTDHKLAPITDYSAFQSVVFSFDAASPALYEHLRRGAKFAPTLERIKGFIARLDRTRTSIWVNYTMLLANLHEIRAAIDLWEDVGVDGVSLLISSDRQNNTFLQSNMYSVAPERFQAAVTDAADHFIASRCRMTLSSALMPTADIGLTNGAFLDGGTLFSGHPQPRFRATPEPPDPFPGQCRSPLREVRIRWNGNVYLCSNRFLIGNIRKQPLAEIWHDKLARLTRTLVGESNRYCLDCCYFHYCLSGRTDLDVSAAAQVAESLG